MIETRPNTDVNWFSASAAGYPAAANSKAPEFLDSTVELSEDGLTRTTVTLYSTYPASLTDSEEKRTVKDLAKKYHEDNNITTEMTVEEV
jgi:hypothetical protein